MSFRVSHLWRARRTAGPARDVLVALALKGLLLLAIYLAFFGPAHRPSADAGATAQALIGVRASKDTP